MAMVETTFTVQTQTWVNPGETYANIDYLRTWRELYRQIANAGIGWTLEVTTDTLNGKNSGTFAGKMHHTATGLWYNCYSSTSVTSTDTYIYTATNKRISNIWLAVPLWVSYSAVQNVYFVDNINGGTFQDCRMSQGRSACLWRIAQGELIDGTVEGYNGYNYYYHSSAADASVASSTLSAILGLVGYSDTVGVSQEVAYSSIYGTVGSASQLYMGRCYGIRSGQTNGIIVTWGGKKTWRTSYTLVPKATYSINGTRYTALSENILLEE